VTLIGSPSAAAVPVTEDLLESYNAWLIQERRHLLFEMYPGKDYDNWRPKTAGGMYHWRALADQHPIPSSRAAVVLSAVGCGWRQA
jgi:hypothetical protein